MVEAVCEERCIVKEKRTVTRHETGTPVSAWDLELVQDSPIDVVELMVPTGSTATSANNATHTASTTNTPESAVVDPNFRPFSGTGATLDGGAVQTSENPAAREDHVQAPENSSNIIDRRPENLAELVIASAKLLRQNVDRLGLHGKMSFMMLHGEDVPINTGHSSFQFKDIQKFTWYNKF